MRSAVKRAISSQQPAQHCSSVMYNAPILQSRRHIYTHTHRRVIPGSIRDHTTPLVFASSRITTTQHLAHLWTSPVLGIGPKVCFNGDRLVVLVAVFLRCQKLYTKLIRKETNQQQSTASSVPAQQQTQLGGCRDEAEAVR